MGFALLCLWGSLLALADTEDCADTPGAPAQWARLKPLGQCGDDREGPCPYRIILPPLNIQLPKAFRDLEKMSKELQNLKETVNQLRRACQECKERQREERGGQEHEEREDGETSLTPMDILKPREQDHVTKRTGGDKVSITQFSQWDLNPHAPETVQDSSGGVKGFSPSIVEHEERSIDEQWGELNPHTPEIKGDTKSGVGGPNPSIPEDRERSGGERGQKSHATGEQIKTSGRMEPVNPIMMDRRPKDVVAVRELTLTASGEGNDRPLMGAVDGPAQHGRMHGDQHKGESPHHGQGRLNALKPEHGKNSSGTVAMKGKVQTSHNIRQFNILRATEGTRIRGSKPTVDSKVKDLLSESGPISPKTETNSSEKMALNTFSENSSPNPDTGEKLAPLVSGTKAKEPPGMDGVAPIRGTEEVETLSPTEDDTVWNERELDVLPPPVGDPGVKNTPGVGVSTQSRAEMDTKQVLKDKNTQTVVKVQNTSRGELNPSSVTNAKEPKMENNPQIPDSEERGYIKMPVTSLPLIPDEKEETTVEKTVTPPLLLAGVGTVDPQDVDNISTETEKKGNALNNDTKASISKENRKPNLGNIEKMKTPSEMDITMQRQSDPSNMEEMEKDDVGSIGGALNIRKVRPPMIYQRNKGVPKVSGIRPLRRENGTKGLNMLSVDIALTPSGIKELNQPNLKKVKNITGRNPSTMKKPDTTRLGGRIQTKIPWADKLHSDMSPENIGGVKTSMTDRTGGGRKDLSPLIDRKRKNESAVSPRSTKKTTRVNPVILKKVLKSKVRVTTSSPTARESFTRDSNLIPSQNGGKMDPEHVETTDRPTSFKSSNPMTAEGLEHTREEINTNPYETLLEGTEGRELDPAVHSLDIEETFSREMVSNPITVNTMQNVPKEKGSDQITLDTRRVPVSKPLLDSILEASRISQTPPTENEMEDVVREANQPPDRPLHRNYTRTNADKDKRPPQDCSDHIGGHRGSGLHSVRPHLRNASFYVPCDLTTSGGGWTLIQRRHDGSVNFNRTWQDYKRGFGDLRGEFWLGNDKIHQLTTPKQMTLRIELEDLDGDKGYAEYESFRVANESQRYQLTISGYSGTAGDAMRHSKEYDHNQRYFSTWDRDNDRYPSGNCGVYYSSGWWFDACLAANLNGKYYKTKYKGVRNGIFWGAWHNMSREYYPTLDRQSFKTVRMMIRPLQHAP